MTSIKSDRERMDRWNHIKELLYRCKFNAAIGVIDVALNSKETTSDDVSELALLKANALTELQQVDAARALVDGFAQNKPKSALAWYCQARTYYLIEQYEQAEVSFNASLKLCKLDYHKIPVMLGLANTHFSKGNDAEAVSLVSKIRRQREPVSPIEDICVELLEGHISVRQVNLTKAEAHFRKGLKLSSQGCWLYLQLLSLYGLATVQLQNEDWTELRYLLGLIRDMCDKDEAVRLLHVIDRRFAGVCFGISGDIEFNETELTIKISRKRFELNKAPMVFRILATLNSSRCYLSKEAISSSLWPHESYDPTRHDQRTFFLVRRARVFLKSVEEPVLLRSGPEGYFLKKNLEDEAHV